MNNKRRARKITKAAREMVSNMEGSGLFSTWYWKKLEMRYAEIFIQRTGKRRA